LRRDRSNLRVRADESPGRRRNSGRWSDGWWNDGGASRRRHGFESGDDRSAGGAIGLRLHGREPALDRRAGNSRMAAAPEPALNRLSRQLDAAATFTTLTKVSASSSHAGGLALPSATTVVPACRRFAVLQALSGGRLLRAGRSCSPRSAGGCHAAGCRRDSRRARAGVALLWSVQAAATRRKPWPGAQELQERPQLAARRR